MANYLVTRHVGTIKWAEQKGLDMEVLQHIESSMLSENDFVYGNLPVHVVAKICLIGIRYFHLCIDVPISARGSDLTAEQLDQFGAEFREYRVELLKD